MKNSFPLISVITPIFNGKKNVKKLINSLSKQTYPKYEHIIVDNCSTDGTYEELLKYASDNVKIYQTPTQSGGSSARNFGVSKAKGQYLAFLDDDDEMLPDRLIKQLEYLQENDLDAVTCGYIDKSDGKEYYPKLIEKNQRYIIDLFSNELRLGSGSTVFVSLEAFNKVKGFNTKYRRHQDIEFVLKLMINGKFGIVPEVLGIINKRSYRTGNISTSFATKLLESKELLFSDFQTYLLSIPKSDREYIYARNYLQVAKFFLMEDDFNSFKALFLKSLSHKVLVFTRGYIINSLYISILLELIRYVIRSIKK